MNFDGIDKTKMKQQKIFNLIYSELRKPSLCKNSFEIKDFNLIWRTEITVLIVFKVNLICCQEFGYTSSTQWILTFF